MLVVLGLCSDALADWPKGVTDVEYVSTGDGTQQPALAYAAKSTDRRPLLVGLHTWSGNYRQGGGEEVFARWCVDMDWHFIHPDFRGPNWTPDALGSDLMVADITSAVEYMKRTHAVDSDRIYLVGVSGGGHAAMLMAGRRPEIWAGVSAWAGISDINAWWDECNESNRKYAQHIEKACGGKPTDPKVLEQCTYRSPITYLTAAGSVNFDINHGINDGRNGSVPFTHSLHAFNQVAATADRLSATEITEYYKTTRRPATLAEPEVDSLYQIKEPVFRRVSGNTRVTIFNGGHEIIHNAALNWLAAQRKGKAAVWEVTDISTVKASRQDADSGK